MKTNILDINELDFVYPDGTHALNKLTVSFEKGKKIAIVGPNGAGKTTLFLVLTGVYKPTGGKVSLSGLPIHYSKREIMELRKHIGIVFQDSNSQLFSANVYQEISFGPLNLELTKDEVKQRIENALIKTNIIHLKSKPVHFLSGGEKKRVAIADILAMEPEVLFLDEPTAFIDPKTSNELMDLFDEINKEGKTIVLSTHDMDRVYTWADYVIVMKEGTVIGEGLPHEIFLNNDLLKKADLEKPWIIDVYQQIIKDHTNPMDMGVPRNKKELFELLGQIPKQIIHQSL